MQSFTKKGARGVKYASSFVLSTASTYKVPGPEHPEEHGYVSINGVCVVDEEVCIGCKLCAKYCPWEVIDMVTRDEMEGVPG